MIRILIVDAFEPLRRTLIRILGTDPDLEVIGEASDGYKALELTKKLRPSLILMSARLPRMDGFEATRSIMTDIPTPIVILSDDVDDRQVELSMYALRAGAVSVQPKPKTAIESFDSPSIREFVIAIKAMAQIKLVRRWPDKLDRSTPQAAKPALRQSGRRVVAIGASTGGPAALQTILSELPSQFPFPILVVQHIAAGFAQGFASWLNAASPLRVKIAEHGELLHPHTVYVADEHRHMGTTDRSRILLSEEPPIGGFRPSATFLFDSVTRAFGAAAINIILTGMGHDGLDGLRVARSRGGLILAQDEESSVVFGMPGVVVAAGLPNSILPLSKIASWLKEISSQD